MIQMLPLLAQRVRSVSVVQPSFNCRLIWGVDDYQYLCWAGLILTRLCLLSLFEDHQENKVEFDSLVVAP